MKKLLLLSVIILLLCGCSILGAFNRDVVIKYPDAPMLILKPKRGKFLVSVYDKSTNSMIEYGYILTENLEGWTLHKFDWQNYINKKKESQ